MTDDQKGDPIYVSHLLLDTMLRGLKGLVLKQTVSKNGAVTTTYEARLGYLTLLLGDRAYALIAADTGKVVSAKSIRLFPGLLQCQAEFVEAPKRGGEMPLVRITLSSGKSVRSDAADVDQVLSEHFHRSGKLARAAPDDFTIDQSIPISSHACGLPSRCSSSP